MKSYQTHLPLITLDIDGHLLGVAISNQQRTRKDENPIFHVAPPQERPLRSVVSEIERDRAIRLFYERYPPEGR